MRESEQEKKIGVAMIVVNVVLPWLIMAGIFAIFIWMYAKSF